MGGKGSGRFFDEHAQAIQRARNGVMKAMRDDGLSLREIGEHFGISRERVRQVIGNTGYRGANHPQIANGWLKRQTHLTNNELAQTLGVDVNTVVRHRSGIRHAVENDCTVHTAFVWEKWVSRKLFNNGIQNVLMPNTHPFDILAIDSVRIDVKSSNPLSCPTNPKMINPQYSFSVHGGRKHDDADFYLCVAIDIEELFVIPASDVPASYEYIRFVYPTARPDIGKYQKYSNRFDLIVEFANTQV